MFIDLVRQRKSVRKYLPRPVEAEKVDLLVEAALRAPSSRGLDPCEFVVVTDPALLADLSRAKPHGATFLKDAPLGIVVCADPGKSDVWVEDASIATLLLHLEAASLDLGSCWIQIRERHHDGGLTASRYVAERVGLPEHLEVEAIVAVGYPAGSGKRQAQGELAAEKVSYERYGRRR